MLQHYRISISQLSPNGYRKLLCFELLCRALGLAPSKKSFHYFYHIAASDEWFTFSIRSKHEHIVSGLKPYNKKWMNKLLWIKKSCFPTITEGGETWHLKRDTYPKLTTHLQGLVDIVKEHTVYDRNFPESILVAAGMSRNWPHDGFQPCFMEGENGMGETGDNVIIPLRTSSCNAREADPWIPSSSGVINKRPRVACNEDLLGGGVQVSHAGDEVGIRPEDFQLSPVFTIVPRRTNLTSAIMSPRGTAQGVQPVSETPVASVPDNGANFHLNGSTTNANRPMQPMVVNDFLNNGLSLTKRENAAHSSESLIRSSFRNGLQETLKYGLEMQKRLEEVVAQNQILRENACRLEQIIGGHRDNAHQLAVRLSGGIDSNHSLFFSNEEFVTGAQRMVQNLNNDIERLRGENRDLKEKYDIALQLGNVVESLRQENVVVRQDFMWVMRTAIPLMINKVIWSEEFTEGMLKVLEHVMRYGRQLGQCDVVDGFAAGTSNLEPPCSDFSLPQNVMDVYTMFRLTRWKCVDDILGSPYLSPSSLCLALGLSGTGSSQDVLLPLIMLASFFARLFKMTNFAAKHSIMTPEMVENFCNDYYIPDEVHPVAPGRDKTITQFPEGKVGVYTRFFDYCGYRIPFTKFLMAVLRYFRIHISQLSPFGAARVSHFEVLTRVLDLAPSVTVFRAFYTRTYSDGLFSFAKRSPSSPSCFPKPPDSIKNWSDHFFWVDAKVFPIPVSLYVGGALEKDPAPHLTARQEQTVRLLENNKAPFRRYPECFLCLVGLSPYYPFDENTYPAFERPDGTDMGLLDFIKTADPRKVQAVEVQKKDDQVKLLESTSHCFMPLVTPAAGGSSSAAAPEVSASVEVEPENVVSEDTYLDLTGPDELRNDHPSFATGTGGKILAGLRQLMPTSLLVSRPSFQADIQAHVVQSARITDVPLYIAVATVTSARENMGITPTSDIAGSSQLETSEGSDDSFYELPALNSAEAKR
ncbi:hypothetical protein Tco_1316999 [Tanacetum coccineum]